MNIKDCPKCNGQGEVRTENISANCSYCGGTGKLKADNPTSDTLQDYRDECVWQLGFKAHDPEEVIRWCYENLPRQPDPKKCVHKWISDSLTKWRCDHCGVTIELK